MTDSPTTMRSDGIVDRRGKGVNRRPSVLRRWTAPLRVLPSFIFIGAQKSGTTTLYEHLAGHPAFERSVRQEVHYFDKWFDYGPLEYRAYFPLRARRLYLRYFRGLQLCTGEASGYYLLHPWVPERVHELLPEIRLVVVLRDPVERAWAHYHQNLPKGENLSFEEAIKAEEERIGAARTRVFEYGEYNHAYGRFGYLERGRYAEQLSRWYRFFPKNRILVIKSEDLIYDATDKVVQETGQFLGLEGINTSQYRPYPRDYYPRMNESTNSRLREHFAPLNQQLYTLLEKDFGW